MKLYLDSIIDGGNFSGMKLSDVIKNDKKNIFTVLKDGYDVDESVLQKLSIKRNIRSVSGNCVVAEHDNSQLKVKMKVDSIDVNSIIRSMNYNDSFQSYKDEYEDSEIDNNEN